MSNLDYPISILQSEREKICNQLQLSGDNQMQNVNRFDEINRAIHILVAEKMKDAIPYIKKL